MGWRIYYAGGRRFTNRDSVPEVLPKDGVLGVVKFTGRHTKSGVPYRHILSGDDRYFYWQGEWFSNSDAKKDIERRYPGAVILRGKWVPDAEMQQVQAEMAADREES